MQTAWMPVWWGAEAQSPVVAVAIHAGHQLRPEVASLVAVDEPSRRRQEDPYTDRWTALAGTRLVARRSRFEVHLNRPRDHAVYVAREDAWGLDVWRRTLPPGLVDRSLAVYDTFYTFSRGPGSRGALVRAG